MSSSSPSSADYGSAGYLEDWKFNKTLSGVPQGGIVSPVLSNIYLDRLDKYVEQTLVPQYTRKERRRVNRDYERLADQAGYYRRKGEREKAMHLKRQAQHLPSLDPADPEYRRLRYIRYADDVRHLTRCSIPLRERRSSEEMTSGSLSLPGGES
jgi:retron-type reverse transcriptase